MTSRLQRDFNVEIISFNAGSWFVGDCVEYMRAQPAGVFDLTVTSPPYDKLRNYEGFSVDFAAVFGELYRTTREGGVLVWVVGDQTKDGCESLSSFRQAILAVESGFKLLDTMIFVKSGSGAAGSRNCYWQVFDYMFVFTKGKPDTVNLLHDVPNKFAGERTTKGRVNRNNELRDRKSRIIPEYSKRGNVWRYAVGNNNGDYRSGHPAPFPEVLASDLISSWSDTDNVVFDPFGGSGTTAAVAQAMGRKFVSGDISPEYATIAVDRLLNLGKSFPC